MKRTTTLLAAPIGVVVVVGLLLLGSIALSGCAQPTAVVAVPPTATVFAPPPTRALPELPPPTPAALEFPLPPPERPASQPVSDQTCVDCHTDKERVQALAKEEEVAEELSEGEG
jgi:hypothetical protein